MIGVIEPAEQITCVAGEVFATGVGFTSTVAEMDVPEQLPDTGVIVKVTVTGALVVFVSVPLMLPVPEAGIPVTVATLFRIQLKVVPGRFPVRRIVEMAAAEQIAWVAGVATAFGLGLTRTVAVAGIPEHPFATGVIVKVTRTGFRVVLVREPKMFPDPLAGMPVTVATLSLVQLKIAVDTLLERLIVSM